MTCDHIDFKIYIDIQVSHNHDNHHFVFLEDNICTSMAHDYIDLRYIHKT